MMKTSRLAGLSVCLFALTLALMSLLVAVAAQAPECGPAMKFATPAKAGTHPIPGLPQPAAGQSLHVCAGEIVVAGSPTVTFAWNGVSVKAASGRQVFQIPSGPVPAGEGLSLKVSTGIAVTGWVRVRVVGAVTPAPTPVDCQVSAWGAWARVGTTATEERARTVTRPAEPGGAACPALSESRPLAVIQVDTDGDEVSDALDACPIVPGLSAHSRAFPELMSKPLGCPVTTEDRDGDGIGDPWDFCPGKPSGGNLGCPTEGPDRDGDGLPDEADLCPDERAMNDPMTGCIGRDRDTDGDYIDDTFDICPVPTAEKPDSKGPRPLGCPLDLDKDDVFGDADKCPLVFARTADGCAAPPPVTRVDCVVSGFGPWVIQPSQTQERRERIVITQAANGGAECPALFETRAYVPPPPPSGDSPLARNERPRMLVTSDNLPRLRARMATGGGLHDDAVWWAATLDQNLDNAWMRGDLIYHNYALAYLFLKDGPIPGVPFRRSALEYGTAAKSMALGYLEGAEADVMLIMMLDWLWDLWTPAERLRLTAFIKSSDAKTDWGGAWVSQHAWIRAVRTVGAIALHGAGLEDEWAKDRLSSFRAWFRDQTGITRAESDLGAGVDAGCGQSSSYCDNTLTNLLLAEEAYRTAYNIPDAVHYGGADTNFFRLQAEYDLHHLMPNADPAMRVRYPWTLDRGRYGQSGQIIGPDRASGTSYLSIAGMYESFEPQVAAKAMWMMDRVWGGPYHGWTFLAHDWWWFHGLIRGPERRPTATPPAEMGKPFHVVSPNMGRVLWSTNWLRPDDVQVVFDAEHWALADSLLRPGTFQVFRKGPMIVHQGGGTGGHDQTPCNGAHSGNILLFPLPRMNDCGGSSGGGQNSGSNLFIPGSVSDLRDALDVVDTPTYGYLYADITRAYRSTRRQPPFDQPPPLRVSEVTRQIAYLKPATTSDPVILVILDRATTTAADMEKRWLVHPACAPVVQPDASIQCVNTEFGSNGKVIITPILPATRTVKVWEGYDSPYGDMAKPIASQMPAQYQWVGNWTLDLRPTVPQTSDVFLTVIEVTDANGTKTPVKYLGGESVQVGSRIVTFSATGVVVK